MERVSQLLLLVLSVFIYATQAQRVFVKTPYDIEDGKFLVFERYENEVILNEYPAFYSEKCIPNCKADRKFV